MGFFLWWTQQHRGLCFFWALRRRQPRGSLTKALTCEYRLRQARGLHLYTNTCFEGKIFSSSKQSADAPSVWQAESARRQTKSTGNGKNTGCRHHNRNWAGGGTDLVICPNPHTSKNLLYRKKYRPGKAATADSLAHSQASLPGRVSWWSSGTALRSRLERQQATVLWSCLASDCSQCWVSWPAEAELLRQELI